MISYLRGGFKHIYIGFAVLFAAHAAAPHADAVPVSTTLKIVDSGPNTSFIGIDLSLLGGTITTDITTFLSGEIDVTLDNVGLQALEGTINEASISLSDVSVSISAGIFGGVEGALVDTSLSILGIPHAQLPNSSGANSFFDLAGDTISIDSGLLTYIGTGAAGGALGSGTFDLAAEPISVPLPQGSTIQIIEEAVSATKNNVTVIVPVEIPSTTLVTDPVDVSASLSALILATGMKIIPEPGTLVLLSVGVIGLLVVIRRCR